MLKWPNRGATASTDFPPTRGAFQTTHGGGVFDAFVTKLTHRTHTGTATQEAQVDGSEQGDRATTGWHHR